jgi:hypothetical protein
MERIDFQEVKAKYPVEVVARDFLKLPLKAGGEDQWRCACPACGSKDDRSLVVTVGKGAYCRVEKKGGDVIFLVHHVLKIGMRQAAEAILAHFQAPQSFRKVAEVLPQPENPLQKIAERLVHEHEAVQALGFDPETAERCNIGFDGKGLLRGRVAFPIFEDGTLIGFIGYKDGEFKIPDSLKVAENVATFTRKAG